MPNKEPGIIFVSHPNSLKYAQGLGDTKKVIHINPNTVSDSALRLFGLKRIKHKD